MVYNGNVNGLFILFFVNSLAFLTAARFCGVRLAFLQLSGYAARVAALAPRPRAQAGNRPHRGTLLPSLICGAEDLRKGTQWNEKSGSKKEGIEIN